MNNTILSINAGSSSLKFKLLKMPDEALIAEGMIERIGLDDGIFTIKRADGTNYKCIKPIVNHEIATELLLNKLIELKIIEHLDDIKGVGHRVAHGGEIFTESVVITEGVLKEIESITHLAPLHNPANVTGIKLFKRILPDVPSVAVFDTSFHQSMLKEAYVYGTPFEWYEEYGVRKYGFHGTSHKYVSERIEEYIDKPNIKAIICHLGNGGSLCAVDRGQSIDTTMGFTPLAGILMGTRSGDVDPAVISYMMKTTNKSISEIENELNKQSGLLGVSGTSNDFRDIEQGIINGDKRCELAKDIFIRRIVSYIGSYHVILGGADAIVFTAGIGENSIKIREEIMNRLKVLGIKLDQSANNVRGIEREISSADSTIKCFIIPTDEEVMIARDTFNLIV